MSNQKKLFDIKVSEIDEKDIIRGFIATANMGLCNKDEILEKSQIVEKNIDDLNSRLAELEDAAQKWGKGFPLRSRR